MKTKFVGSIVAILVVMLMQSALFAQPGGGGPPQQRPNMPTLVVSGSGEAWGKPDRASITIGASNQSKTAAEAQQKVSLIVDRALQGIKALGIAEENIQTADLSIYPVHNEDNKIIAYRASNTIRIRVDDLSKIGNVIDAAIESGANEMQGLSFEMKDNSPLQNEALRDATKKARAKAETLADAMGMRLGRVMEVIESGATISPPTPYMEMAAVRLMDKSTPVQPGQLSVHQNVTIRYSIIGPPGDPGAGGAVDGGAPGPSGTGQP